MMHIHKRFDTEEAYLDYAWLFLNARMTLADPVWRAEDLPLLKPIIDWQAQRVRDRIAIYKKLRSEEEEPQLVPFPDEVSASFEQLLRCKTEYADAIVELRQTVANISREALLAGFLISARDSHIDGKRLSRADLYLTRTLTFPLVLTGVVNSIADRLGKGSIVLLDIVEKLEFESKDVP